MGVSRSEHAIPPATHAALVRVIRKELGAEPDSALLAEMFSACQQNALEATGEPASEEELIYFTTAKAGTLARAPNIRNHLAVLIRAVPECFRGEAFRAYRAAVVSGSR